MEVELSFRLSCGAAVDRPDGSAAGDGFAVWELRRGLGLLRPRPSSRRRWVGWADPQQMVVESTMASASYRLGGKIGVLRLSLETFRPPSASFAAKVGFWLKLPREAGRRGAREQPAGLIDEARVRHGRPVKRANSAAAQVTFEHQ